MTRGHPDYRGRSVNAMFLDPVTGVEQVFPAEGLPYGESILSEVKPNIANMAGYAASWTSADWGAGKKFFVRSAHILNCKANTEPCDDFNEALLLYVDAPNILYSKNHSPRWVWEGGVWIINIHCIPEKIHLVAEAATIRFVLENYSGVNLISTMFYIRGVAI